MRLNRTNLLNVFFITLVCVVAAFGTYTYSIKQDLAAAIQGEAELNQKISTILSLIPSNSAQWWKRGCEQTIEAYAETLPDPEIDGGMTTFLIRLKCEQQANLVEEAVRKAMFDPSSEGLVLGAESPDESSPEGEPDDKEQSNRQ